MLWFTGQNDVYGRLDQKSGAIAVFDVPRGIGPYGIATTADGVVFFASLVGNYLGQIDLETGTVTVLEPPLPPGLAACLERQPWRVMDYRLE